MKGKRVGKLIALFAVTGILAGCGGKTGGTPDDYATNDGYLTTEAAGNGSGSSQSETGQTSGTAGIAKEDIKVGVLYISDPDEGSGYSYTHDLGIVGMQENLGLSDDQIERKLWTIQMQKQRRRQSKPAFRMDVILFLQQAGVIWK